MNISIQESIHQLASAFSSQNIENLCSLVTDDISYMDKAFGVKAEGLEEFRAVFTWIFDMMPDYTMEIQQIHIGDDFAAVEWISSATAPESFGEIKVKNQRYSQPMASIIEFSENKIKRISDYWDVSPILA